MSMPVERKNSYHGYSGDAADPKQAFKDMNTMSCGVPVEVKETLDKSGWTRFKQGATAYGGKAAIGLGTLAGFIPAAILATGGSAINYACSEDPKKPWKWLKEGGTELWDKTNEYKKGMKEGVKVERAVRTAAPWKETTVRNHPDTNLKPIRPYTPEAIKARFENGNDNVEFDNDTSNHYIIDTANGVVLLKINEGEEVKYKAIYIFDPAKKNGNHVKDPNTLRKMARTMLANHDDSKSGSALQKYDVLVFHISNLGGAKHLDIRGFNYEKWQRNEDGDWCWNPERGPFEKVDLTSTRYGEEVKYEDDLKKALCRIFNMDDKPSLQEGNKDRRAEGSGKSRASSKPLKAPKGYHFVSTEGDGECGYRALNMGVNFVNHSEDELKAIYNAKKGTGMKAVVTLRNQIADQIDSEFKKLRENEDTRIVLLEGLKEAALQESNDGNNAPELSAIVDAMKKRKSGSSQADDYNTIVTPFLAVLRRSHDKGGVQMNATIAKCAATALKRPIKTWIYDSKQRWTTPDEMHYGQEYADKNGSNTINVYFNGNHYTFLAPNGKARDGNGGMAAANKANE